MGENEYGPFDDERQALATRAAAVIRAAFNAKPGVGASVPERLRLMTGECEATGVELGKVDLSFLQGVAWGETADCVSLRGLVHRAYEAGLAARDEGTVTEWGVCRQGEAMPFASGPSEGAVRRFAASLPLAGVTVVRRQAGPWEEAKDHD